MSEIKNSILYVQSLEEKKETIDSEFNESLPELVRSARKSRQELVDKKGPEKPKLLADLEEKEMESINCKDIDH